ncbi:MAG: hypothetical protein ACLPYS_19380, partial [Vulcanimicrobiaceae bacterium]
MGRRGRKPASWSRKLAGITVCHRPTGFDAPTEHQIVRTAHRGLRRRAGVAQQQKNALVDDALRQIVGAIDRKTLAPATGRCSSSDSSAPSGARSPSLDVEDLRFEPEGIIVRLRRSKGDQEKKQE